MSRLYGDPDEVDHLARTLRSRAAAVRDSADQQLARAQAAQWVSVAARAYQERLMRRRIEAYEVADSLEQAAAELQAHAQEVRERVAAIARIEREVTDWFGRRANEVGEALRSGVRRVVDELPWSGWPYSPRSLPPPGDRGWLDVAEFMRRKGVW